RDKSYRLIFSTGALVRTGEAACRYVSHYSYRRLSTGSSLAARVAGTVPKRTPTREDTTMATIADSPEMGMRYSVKKRTEKGSASPMTTPTTPPIREIRMASDRN